MGERDLRFRLFAWTVTITATLGLVWSWDTRGYVAQWPLLATLGGAVAVSEMLAIDLPSGGSISITYPLGVCTIVLFGATGAAGLAVLSMLPSMFPHRRMTLTKVAFNAGQLALSALVPAWLYSGLGGHVLAREMSAMNSPAVLPALIAAATVGILVNFSLGGLGYSMMHNLTLRQVWRQVFSWWVASQVALGLLGLAIAQVMASEGPLGFALFVVPLVVARQMHRRYLSLREAYADTVRSLVAAIEAKDPYTKGHSVRVARFAVAVAHEMSLNDSVVQRLEYAALLHDLGKVGISRSVLSKRGALTDDEYDWIKQHPDIGARILESVPFLDDVRPIVQAHHGRVDGGGYGMGLRGDDMPLEARILAVADSFDAMTAERPYRTAMSVPDAVGELRANGGTQFDAVVVEALIAAIPSSNIGGSGGHEAQDPGLAIA